MQPLIQQFIKVQTVAVVSLVPGAAAAPVRGGTIGGVPIAYVEKVNPTPTGLITPRYLMPNAPVENPAGQSRYTWLQLYV